MSSVGMGLVEFGILKLVINICVLNRDLTLRSNKQKGNVTKIKSFSNLYHLKITRVAQGRRLL